MKGTHVINVFGITTKPKARNFATPMVVSKDGYRVELPGKCFYKKTGIMKPNVLKHVVGHWNEEKVQYLVHNFGAVLLEGAKSA